MFGRKKAVQTLWRQEGKIPVIRASICTGEKVAGFQDIHTGKFTEIMLISFPALNTLTAALVGIIAISALPFDTYAAMVLLGTTVYVTSFPATSV